MSNLTPETTDGTVKLTEQELDLVLKLVATKLPKLLDALDSGGNGWKQILMLACYLVAAVLNRHPEYAENFDVLIPTFQNYYAMLDADFAAKFPALWYSTIQQDVATVLVPTPGTTGSLKSN